MAQVGQVHRVQMLVQIGLDQYVVLQVVEELGQPTNQGQKLRYSWKMARKKTI